MHRSKFFKGFILGLFFLSILIPLSVTRAQGNNGNEIPLDEASVFFELNNTDGDLGIHSLIDGEPWSKIVMKDPNGRRMLVVNNKGRLGLQGLTELFFESAEPQFSKLAPEDFFERFPEGIYEVEGTTIEGELLEGEAEVTHLMAAPPGNISISGEDPAKDCDSELPMVPQPLNISWNPVITSHPEIGSPNSSGDITVVAYQVVIDRLAPTPFGVTFDLSPGQTMVELPDGLFNSGDEIKLEILVREASGNQTATETCFIIQ